MNNPDDADTNLNPATVTTAAAMGTPAANQPPIDAFSGNLNLIDPKLMGRSLKRLQAIIRGNGLKADDVSVESCEVGAYPFRGRLMVKLTPRYGIKTEPGQNRKAELVVSQEDFNLSLQTTVHDVRRDPAKRQLINDFIFQRPDKGFGMPDQKVSFHKLNRDFVMHEGCTTCARIGKVRCQTCGGDGIVTCNLCMGRKDIVCPQCRGTAKVAHGNSHRSCEKCRGDGKVRCTRCAGRGQLPCAKCAQTGNLNCQKCAATGWLSHLSHVEMDAQIHFEFDRNNLPLEVVKKIEAFGSRLVERGDVEVMLQPPPVSEEDFAQLQEPPDMIFMDYDAKAPYGPIHFRLKDRVIPAILFGYQGRLIEAPSFLDDMTRKGQNALQDAANGVGHIVDKVHRAAKYRMLRDVILCAADGMSQKTALDIITNRYPTGIGSDKLLNILILADKALKTVTRKGRSFGLIGGLALAAGLHGIYFLMGLRAMVLGLGIPDMAIAVLDIVLPIAGGSVLGLLGAQLLSQIALKTALKPVLAAVPEQQRITKIKAKLGNTFLWSLGATLVIWLALNGTLLAMHSALTPHWLASLLGQ